MSLFRKLYSRLLKGTCILILLLSVFMWQMLPLRVFAQPITMAVFPSSQVATLGETFQVNVTVADVTSIAAWQFRLYFFNNILKCSAVTEGSFLKSAGDTLFTEQINNSYDSTYGFVLAASNLLDLNASVNGTGTLATLTFEAIGLGNTTLRLADTELADGKIPPNLIPHTTADGAVNVKCPPCEVSIYPSNLTGLPGWINLGDTFTLNVSIASVLNLNYWQAGLSFNPSVLECINYTEGPFLKTGGTTVWQPGTIDNEAGIITPHGASLNSGNGVSGNGTLGFISFKVKSTGSSSLILSDVILLDWNYTQIQPITLHNGYFELLPGQPKPPTAYFTCSPASPYVNETVTFDASGSAPNGGSITSYDWDFGDNSTGQGMITNHTYTNAGDYNATLTVTNDQNLTGTFTKFITVSALPVGPALDVYTQRGGKGPNEPSDTFAPEELMIITAYATYNLVPVANKLVTFNLYFPNDTLMLSRASETGDDGLASIVYLIAAAPIFGTYTINASTTVGEQSVSDSLRFRINWLVEVVKVVPSDMHGVQKNEFQKGEPLYLMIQLQNNRFHSTYVTLCVTVFDELQNFLLFSSSTNLADSGQTNVLVSTGPVSTNAYIGNATAYTFAAQWLGGPAFSPELPASFWILAPVPNVAVVGMTASPLNTYVGNSVIVDVTVMNKYYLPQSFTVTAYCNSTAFQTLIITNLAPYVETNITCIWDTYMFAPGDYTIWAHASPVQGETDLSDNTCYDGSVHLSTRSSPVDDVAVTNVTDLKAGSNPFPTIGQNYTTSIVVYAQNQGDYPETFNVTVYANQTVITEFLNITLASGDNTTLTTIWNTTLFTYGNYTISAYAWPVPGETDTADNAFTGGSVLVTIPGDVDGDLKVAPRDLALLIAAYGAPRGIRPYNPNADIDGDSYVAPHDLAILIAHYGQHYP